MQALGFCERFAEEHTGCGVGGWLTEHMFTLYESREASVLKRLAAKVRKGHPHRWGQNGHASNQTQLKAWHIFFGSEWALMTFLL